VAITIRNKTTEELIRKIGSRTGEGPSAVIRRLAENENRQQPQRVSEDEVKRRVRAMEELAEKYRDPDAPKRSWQQIEREMDSIFGDDFDSVPRNG
jgi:hypothetical protein